MKSALEFLQKVYSQQCQAGDYIILSVKGPDIKWKDVPIVYNKRTFKSKLNQFFEQYPFNKYDLYWSPMPYKGPKRRLENALDTKFLVQDIDEYDKLSKLKPKPTYIWESSPNKYQGMWELDRYIKHTEYTPLNKALAEHIGCDDCFDFVHVYRIPGTVNHKYKNNPKVKILEKNPVLYKPKNIKKIVGQATTKINVTQSKSTDLTERKIYAKYSIPQNVRDLLAIDNLEGVDRSNTIWHIENKLYEIGMTPNEIIHLVKNSAFNKYKGRADELKRLKDELNKIISGDISSKDLEKSTTPLKVSSFENVMSNPKTFGGWLVKGFWGRRSHGIVAGMPKCFKSTLVHDLIVSVASGKPFLGKYPVLDPGPVFVVQNENADYVIKDRTEKLLLQKGLTGRVKKIRGKVRLSFPEALPISFINQQGFVLNNPEHRAFLEKMINEQKPVLVVLDPLYLMFEGDLNSAKDLNPILNWLLYLKNEYNTSVMLIHHYNKGGNGVSNRGGARMMGSIILYGWVESAWYLSKEDQINEENETTEFDKFSNEPSTVSLNREFRMAGNFPDIDIHFTMGEIGNPSYKVDVTATGAGFVKESSIKYDILNTLKMCTEGLSKADIAQRLGVPSSRIKDTINKLIEDGEIVNKNGKGFIVYNGYEN